LKPKDYDDRRQGSYRPQIGFSRDIPRASLSASGHRTLDHHITQQNRRSKLKIFFLQLAQSNRQKTK